MEDINSMDITDAVIFLDKVNRDEDYPKDYKKEVERKVMEKAERELSWQK